MFKLLPIDNEVLQLERLIVEFNEWIDRYNDTIIDVFLKIAQIEGEVYMPDDIRDVLAKKKENIKQELHDKLKEIMNVKYVEPVVEVKKEKKPRAPRKKKTELEGSNLSKK